MLSKDIRDINIQLQRAKDQAAQEQRQAIINEIDLKVDRVYMFKENSDLNRMYGNSIQITKVMPKTVLFSNNNNLDFKNRKDQLLSNLIADYKNII